jgi:hypothetical protein
LYRKTEVTLQLSKDYATPKHADIIAKLYAMEERLTADVFQALLLQFFLASETNWTCTNERLIELLTLADTEITERSPVDDPIRNAIFCLSVRDLSSLQQSEKFRELNENHPDVTMALLMRASNGTKFGTGNGQQSETSTPDSKAKKK